MRWGLASRCPQAVIPVHSHCPRASSICPVRAVCPLRAVTGGLADEDGLGQDADCVPLYLVSGLFWSSSSHMQTSSLLSKPSCARVSAQANSLVCYVICASNPFQSTTPIFRENAFPDTQREVCAPHLALRFLPTAAEVRDCSWGKHSHPFLQDVYWKSN